MILCLDVGNSQIYGGVFAQDDLKLRFRKSSKEGISSDEIGLFLRSVMRENNTNPDQIKKVAICSVVPDLDHSLGNACVKYLGGKPFFLQAGTKTGLKIKYRNPLEVGADRIANAIAATHLYPGKNLIIIDFGTATTLCAVKSTHEYEGGAIIPGFRTSMESLERKTAKLPTVGIIKPNWSVGRSTVESIQAGLYYSQLGMVKELVARMQNEVFEGKKPLVIGTGGFVGLFDNEKIFDIVMPDLVLRGLYLALKMN